MIGTARHGNDLSQIRPSIETMHCHFSFQLTTSGDSPLSRKLMLRALIVPALLLGAPAALIAAPQPPTHEMLRMPAGKTVMVWRAVKHQSSAAIKCHPDPTKAFLCHGRSAPQDEIAATAQSER